MKAISLASNNIGKLNMKSYYLMISKYCISFDISCEFIGIVRTEAFAAQPTLERIDLRNNRISLIDGGAFRGLLTPKDILLAGNRLIQLNSDVFEV